MKKERNYIKNPRHSSAELKTQRFSGVIQYKEEVERKLRPRLMKMGFLLLLFAIGSLLYAVFARPYTPPAPKQNFVPLEERELASGTFEISDAPPFELSEEGRFNFYAIAGIFCAVGISCIIIAKRKLKKAMRAQKKSSEEET